MNPLPQPAETAYQRILTALNSSNRQVVVHADRAMAQCPAHDDRNPSLAVTAIEGQVLIYCHAGCDTESVVRALDMTLADLFDTPRGVTYVYPDERRVHRDPQKRFRQSGNTRGRSLFRADLIASVELVYVVEGEKDVLAVEAAGGTAVCPAMGAGKSANFDWSPLRGKNVVIIADRDEVGRRHASTVAIHLYAIASSVAIVEPRSGKDFADHYAAGFSLADLDTVLHAQSEPESMSPRPASQEKKSAAVRLVELAKEQYHLMGSDQRACDR